MSTESNKLNIDIYGMAEGTSGWATHSLEFSRALKSFANVNFRVSKKTALKKILSSDRRMFLNGAYRSQGDFSVVVTGTPPQQKNAARWIVWETTVLPEQQRKQCDSVEYLWAPSHWGRENLIANGYEAKRIFVVPEGVSTDFYTPTPKPTEKKKFRFLLVGKWEERKFAAGLVRAFAKEFKPHEEVELYLHAHNIYIPGFSLQQQVASLGISNIDNIIIGAPCNKLQLRDLYRSADCFVLPTRAEGWGLPILESMACGVPAIVTRYSAPLDYVTDDNGYLLNVSKMVAAHDPVFGINTGLWAEPDADHLCALMRLAFEKKADLREKGRQAHLDAQAFSWRSSASIATNVIKSLKP